MDIDIEAAKGVDMDRVYAEAVWYLDNGYRYWFDEAEIAELHHENGAFHVQTAEYEMLLKGFEKPEDETESYMTTSEILICLRGYTSLNLQEKRMGEVLKKAEFEFKETNRVFEWILRMIPVNFNYGK